MSGGISAIKGFDYQAVVILDRLFEHFDQHGAAAQVRPEGLDDLDLFWNANGVECRCHIQIKKPQENAHSELKPRTWTVSDVIRDSSRTQ